jgi:ABC-type multidrug transport system ATPase subunit
MSIVQVKNLTKHYREIKAVDRVSFSVQKGEVFGFLGKNGAGKSTIIRMLLTLVEPTEGEIRIFEMDLKTNRRQILSKIGAVIERPDLYKYLTGYENLSIFARLSNTKVTRSKMMEQLERVGLKERMHSKVKTYSQGMRQRLGIAVALVHDPQLIILDEPTNGLDPQGIADMRNLIMSLSKQEGKTILISSHILSEMEMIADSMLILDKGLKIVEGSVKDLINPNRILMELQVVNGAVAKHELQNSAWNGFVKDYRDESILIQLEKNQIPALISDLVAMNVEIMALQPKHTLEEYFLEHTKN